MSSIIQALNANALQVSTFLSAAAAEDRDKEIQAALDARHAAEQRIIDAQNLAYRREQARVYQASQANAYRFSVAQMMDARWKAQEYELLAQDFLNSAGYRRGQMSAAYSRSGALMGGSALARMQMNKEAGEKGAARLRRAAEYAIKRGRMLAKITKRSAIKPAYIPIPDAIKQTYVPRFVPKQGQRSYGSGGSGGRGFSFDGVYNWDDFNAYINWASRDDATSARYADTVRAKGSVDIGDASGFSPGAGHPDFDYWNTTGGSSNGNDTFGPDFSQIDEDYGVMYP